MSFHTHGSFSSLDAFFDLLASFTVKNSLALFNIHEETVPVPLFRGDKGVQIGQNPGRFAYRKELIKQELINHYQTDVFLLSFSSSKTDSEVQVRGWSVFTDDDDNVWFERMPDTIVEQFVGDDIHEIVGKEIEEPEEVVDHTAQAEMLEEFQRSVLEGDAIDQAKVDEIVKAMKQRIQITKESLAGLVDLDYVGEYLIDQLTEEHDDIEETPEFTEIIEQAMARKHARKNKTLKDGQEDVAAWQLTKEQKQEIQAKIEAGEITVKELDVQLVAKAKRAYMVQELGEEYYETALDMLDECICTMMSNIGEDGIRANIEMITEFSTDFPEKFQGNLDPIKLQAILLDLMSHEGVDLLEEIEEMIEEHKEHEFDGEDDPDIQDLIDESNDLGDTDEFAWIDEYDDPEITYPTDELDPPSKNAVEIKSTD